MKFKRSIFVVSFLLLPIFTFAQNDSSDINKDKLILNPNFFGFQIEGTTLLAVGELGGLLDYDIFSLRNKKYYFGLRMSAEYYDFLSLDVGGKSAPGPFLDINIYARHSIRNKNFWFSPLLGFSLHNSLEANPGTSLLLFRIGAELKYNLFKNVVGLVFKFASSFRKETGYVGLGVSIGIYNN